MPTTVTKTTTTKKNYRPSKFLMSPFFTLSSVRYYVFNSVHIYNYFYASHFQMFTSTYLIVPFSTWWKCGGSLEILIPMQE